MNCFWTRLPGNSRKVSESIYVSRWILIVFWVKFCKSSAHAFIGSFKSLMFIGDYAQFRDTVTRETSAECTDHANPPMITDEFRHIPGPCSASSPSVPSSAATLPQSHTDPSRNIDGFGGSRNRDLHENFTRTRLRERIPLKPTLFLQEY